MDLLDLVQESLDTIIQGKIDQLEYETDQLKNSVFTYPLKVLIDVAKHQYHGKYAGSIDLLDKLDNMFEFKDKSREMQIIHILALIFRSNAYLKQAKYKNSEDVLLDCEREIKDELLDERSRDLLSLKIIRISGKLRIIRGDIDDATSFFSKGMSIALEYKDSVQIAILEDSMGQAYRVKGQLQLAKYYHEEALTILEENEMTIYLNDCYDNLAIINRSLKLDKIAEEYLMKSIYLSKDIGNDYDLSNSYYQLCDMYIQSDYTNFQNYFSKLIELAENYENSSMVKLRANLIKAKILKRGRRYEDKIQSKEILTSTLNKDISFELIIQTKLSILELLLEEYELLGDPETLYEIQDILNDLIYQVKVKNISGTLVSLYILQSQLEMLQDNIELCELALMKAKEVVMTDNISSKITLINTIEDQIIEYKNRERIDNILGKEHSASSIRSIVAEIIKYKSLAFSVEDNIPVAFLILDKGGTLFYSRIISRINIQENLLANFISAIISFSQEAFDDFTEDANNVKAFQFQNHRIDLLELHGTLYAYIYIGVSATSIDKLLAVTNRIFSNAELMHTLSRRKLTTNLTDEQEMIVNNIIKEELETLKFF